MKFVLAAAGICFIIGACAPKPPQVYYMQKTVYYTPKKKKATTPAYRPPIKHGGGYSRSHSGSGSSAESFRATTR